MICVCCYLNLQWRLRIFFFHFGQWAFQWVILCLQFRLLQALFRNGLTIVETKICMSSCLYVRWVSLSFTWTFQLNVNVDDLPSQVQSAVDLLGRASFWVCWRHGSVWACCCCAAMSRNRGRAVECWKCGLNSIRRIWRLCHSGPIDQDSRWAVLCRLSVGRFGRMDKSSVAWEKLRRTCCRRYGDMAWCRQRPCRLFPPNSPSKSWKRGRWTSDGFKTKRVENSGMESSSVWWMRYHPIASREGLAY